MKRFILTLSILSLTGSTTQAADQLDCLTRIIHRESRGESVEAVAINAKATINRAEDGKICQLIKSGIVHASKLVPADVRPYFQAIAEAALKTKRDISNGANAWNTGAKPRQPGNIKRVSGGQVFYVLAATPEK